MNSSTNKKGKKGSSDLEGDSEEEPQKKKKIANKKRKFIDEEDDAEDAYVFQQASQKKKEAAKENIDLNAPVPSGPQKGIKKIKRERTVMDDKGYIVTECISEYEEFDLPPPE